ncbi:MAG: phosphoribosylaminoimidazole carboxylase ade2 [Icmadophila ericetorum]|nr:phosphoribosylaminoimidazole carboxylase ade2 [Icmadophila ericetorum]
MDKTVGVLGGGQLGRMLTEAANRLNVNIVTLDVDNAPAKQINVHSGHVTGSFKNPESIRELAQRCDILTVEIEHVDTDVLEDLSEGTELRENWRLVRGTKIEIQPSWKTIRVIQDKFKQKEHLQSYGIPTARSASLDYASQGELGKITQEFGFPVMLKSKTEAYDGRGNYPINSATDIQEALNVLKDRPLYVEEWVKFDMELAVMVVKIRDSADPEGWEASTLAFPVVETVHEDSICKLVYVPARNLTETILGKAQVLARRAVAGLWGKGVFGVEMFLLGTGELLINEIAPRPHNSGHYTMEACPLSQYDAHLRAILDLPIPQESTRLITNNTTAIMLNILGGTEPRMHLRAAQQALSIPGARIHLYGKGDARPGRKMGHVTVVTSDMAEAAGRIEPLVHLVDQIRAERRKPQAKPTLTEVKTTEVATAGETKVSSTALVAVTMGSDSDRSVLKPGVELLKEFGIPYVVTITSAHRTPDRMFKFAKEAASKGIKVIIAAAGGAAHLPGMIAALTSLPVIGVPVRGSVLDGQDSLLSIVQMPRGCPVATVAINNSVNAAQLAVRILGATDVTIRMRLEKYLADQSASVTRKAEKMEAVGIEAYSWEE